MGFNNIILIAILFLFTSCGLYRPKWVDSAENGKQPESKAFKLSKQKFIFNSKIDTNFVYVSENEWVTSDRKGKLIEGKHSAFDFIRLSGNGTAFFSPFNYQPLTDTDFNTLPSGQYCYYAIDNDIIRLEYWNHNTNVFEFWYGRIQINGDILFFKKKGRPWWAYKGKLNYLYRKTPANLKTKIVFPE
jgi:hypothetical protein